jgi:hypothetical protein
LSPGRDNQVRAVLEMTRNLGGEHIEDMSFNRRFAWPHRQLVLMFVIKRSKRISDSPLASSIPVLRLPQSSLVLLLDPKNINGHLAGSRFFCHRLRAGHLEMFNGSYEKRLTMSSHVQVPGQPEDPSSSSRGMYAATDLPSSELGFQVGACLVAR